MQVATSLVNVLGKMKGLITRSDAFKLHNKMMITFRHHQYPLEILTSQVLMCLAKDPWQELECLQAP